MFLNTSVMASKNASVAQPLTLESLPTELWQEFILPQLGSIHDLNNFCLACHFCRHVGNHSALVDRVILAERNPYKMIKMRVLYAMGLEDDAHKQNILSRLLRPKQISTSLRDTLVRLFVVACEEGWYDVVKCLLADPHVCDDEEIRKDAFLYAIYEEHTNIIDLLRADPRFTYPSERELDDFSDTRLIQEDELYNYEDLYAENWNTDLDEFYHGELYDFDEYVGDFSDDDFDDLTLENLHIVDEDGAMDEPYL